MSGRFLIAYIDIIVGYIISFLCLAISLWAFIDCTTRKGPAFEAGFKRTKGFWLGVTGAAVFVGLLSIISPISPMFGPSLFNLAAVTAAGVYLADVRPSVSSR
ncbi:DUF2516 family protein [Sinomonas gamaensis]|uniref:DUF2516 family protein n=1 Tax=Sinomonas gamaensis TaxID=2565624 RepID=UPI001108F790|nr:DUF2516 family protein [Sinomonas gamaensis]